VDNSSQTRTLVGGMDATTGWSSVRQLRAWERERLILRDGETLLDVGCGPGDAGIALVSAAGARARLLGLDASEVMLSVARERAAEAAVPAADWDSLTVDLPDLGDFTALRTAMRTARGPEEEPPACLPRSSRGNASAGLPTLTRA
jgi:SAM-dependent methyltransferase